MEVSSAATEVAKGITDLGMMAMVAGFFLVLSSLLWVACFKWFKSLINDMIKGNSKMVDDLLDETRAQNEMLRIISESLQPETQLRIKNISSVYFDLAVEKVCRMIQKVRRENHIIDRVATVNKIRALVHNLHEDRDSRFDYHTYRGKRLSSYTSDEWIEWVSEVIEREVYSEQVNDERAMTNVSAVYERIKLDFYHKMNS